MARWIEVVLRHERTVTLAGLTALVALAWIYLLRLSREAVSMAEMGMAHLGPWTPADAALAAGMWSVMMVAMMLPSAAPMIFVFVTVNLRRGLDANAPYVSTGLFALGYLLVWGVFSVGATAAQWGSQRAAVLAEATLALTPLAGAAVLVAAGLWQLTPLKYACLARCQSPIGFLLAEWRQGRRGALVMGLRHGLYCLGCCWALMALLFVGGVMNLAWVAAIATFVLVEKTVPAGRVVGWLSGGALIAGGVVMLGFAL